MKILAYTKEVYGNSLTYLVPGSACDAIQTLTGKKTVDNRDLAALRLLGHEVVIYDSEAMAYSSAVTV